MQWIISDIHGCYETLKKLIDRVAQADEDPGFIFVGDYIDRGFKSKEVLDLLCSSQFEGSVFLRGNHDNVVDWILNEECAGDLSECVRGRVCYDSVLTWWLYNGFSPTLKSYGIDIEQDLQKYGTYAGQVWGGVVMAFRDIAPETHKTFLRNLRMSWENDSHFACHAYYDMERDLPVTLKNDEDIHNALWKRFQLTGDVSANNSWNKIGVFGHTPVQHYDAVAPVKYDKLRLIDCGAFMDGYLCAYCCETDNWILQSSVQDDLTD